MMARKTNASGGAWLLPEASSPGSPQHAMGSPSFDPWFILTKVGWSLLMAWVYNRTNKSADRRLFVSHRV